MIELVRHLVARKSTTYHKWEDDAEGMIREIINQCCCIYGGRGNLTVEIWEENGQNFLEVQTFYEWKSTTRYQCTYTDLHEMKRPDGKTMIDLVKEEALRTMARTLFQIGFMGNIPGRADNASDWTNIPLGNRIRIVDFRC